MEHMETALLWLIGLSVLSTIILLWLIRGSKVPRVLDFLVGVQLIVFAAFFLGLLGSLKGMIPDGEKVKESYEVAILIVPFFTAALGTNIISHVFLSSRDYDGAISAKEIGRRVGIGAVAVLSCVFPPAIVFYALAVKKP